LRNRGNHSAENNMSFTAIKKQYISDVVFDQLRDNIYRGEIKAGEKLLPERELADILEVSRSSVRKAINQLIEMGYVENRQGQGNFVKLPHAKDPHNPFSYVMTPGKSTLDELMEVRIGLECHGVALAAARADDKDVFFLEQAFAELTADEPSRKGARDADMKFHMGIAYATHNSVQIDLTRRFYDYMFYSISTLHSILYETHNNLESINKQHYKILEAIRHHDEESARRYMLQHITFLRTFLKETGTV
jgi:DNA-binding FadR family transcriptional regulator